MTRHASDVETRRTIRGLRAKRLLQIALGAVLAAGLSRPPPAAAEVPDAPALLATLGFSAEEIHQVESGEIVHHAVKPASERELTSGLAFQVPVPPGELVKNAQRDLLDQVDPNMGSYAGVSVPATLSDFSKLTLPPEQAQAYRKAEPGGALNLSAEEIAAFQQLGVGASNDAVEAQVRAALLARVQAYQTRGLAGIAPYALAGGKQRSPAEEMKTATRASERLAQYAPDAYQLLLSYPEKKPPGTEEIYRWSRFDAHGVPTIALTHVLLVPDGEAWILAKRQFYVSTGYNDEQSVAAFLPSQGGTVVVYANRISTDQVTGFGGGAKRSIGSKLMASQLESMFERARKELR